jgi:hypothetical protein
LSLLRAFALTLITACLIPAAAHAQASPTGGAAFPTPTPVPTATPAPQNITVPGTVAQILPDGSAAAPALAPPQVQQAIWSANVIQNQDYVYGGGHRDFDSVGYDCSGTVSYALHGGGLLDTPLDSSDFMSWGEPGAGQWITIYTNPGHAYMVIAGLRLDTSAAGVTRATAAKDKKALQSGPRWRPTKRSSRGFTKRHPLGF